MKAISILCELESKEVFVRLEDGTYVHVPKGLVNAVAIGYFMVNSQGVPQRIVKS